MQNFPLYKTTSTSLKNFWHPPPKFSKPVLLRFWFFLSSTARDRSQPNVLEKTREGARICRTQKNDKAAIPALESDWPTGRWVESGKRAARLLLPYGGSRGWGADVLGLRQRSCVNIGSLTFLTHIASSGNNNAPCCYLTYMIHRQA